MALNATRLKGTMKSYIQAIPDFPVSGQSPIIQDDRVLGAIAQAIVDEIQGNMDILPDGHLGEGLSTAAGTASQGSDPQGGTVNSTVTSDTIIVGKGRAQ